MQFEIEIELLTFDFFDEIGRRVSNIFGRLNKVSFGHRIGSFGAGDPASVA